MSKDAEPNYVHKNATLGNVKWRLQRLV